MLPSVTFEIKILQAAFLFLGCAYSKCGVAMGDGAPMRSNKRRVAFASSSVKFGNAFTLFTVAPLVALGGVCTWVEGRISVALLVAFTPALAGAGGAGGAV